MLKTSFILFILIKISRIFCFFKHFILSLHFANGLKALFVNPGYLKCISGINLSPANKNMFTISFILYLLLTCLILSKQKGAFSLILLKGFFIPKLLNNPLASCCLISFHFLLSHFAHFDKSIILPLFVLATSGFLLSVFFYT